MIQMTIILLSSYLVDKLMEEEVLKLLEPVFFDYFLDILLVEVTFVFKRQNSLRKVILELKIPTNSIVAATNYKLVDSQISICPRLKVILDSK